MADGLERGMPLVRTRGENIVMPQLALYRGRNLLEIRNTINRSCVDSGGENTA